MASNVEKNKSTRQKPGDSMTTTISSKSEQPSTSAAIPTDNPHPPWMEELDQQIDDLVKAAPFILPKQFEDVCDYIESRSVTFKLFRNEFNQNTFKKIKNKQERLTRELLQPDWWTSPNQPRSIYYVSLPRNRSLFSVSEMADLYHVHLHSAGLKQQPPSSSQIQTYTNSVANLQTENNEYLQHIKRRWLEESWSRVNDIKEEVTKFVSIWWKNRLDRIELYNETYSKMSPVPLTPSQEGGKIVFLKNLKVLGSRTKYYSSTHFKSDPVSMITVQGELLVRESDRIKKLRSSVKDHEKEVSDDKLAEQFASEHLAELVTTPSVLKTIVTNTPGTFEETWCIPFKIKEVSSGDQKRKVIFMNKKLPPKTLTISDKNALFSRKATRAIYRKSKSTLSSMDLDAPVEDYEHDDESDKEDDQLPLKKRLRKELRYNLWEYSTGDEHSVLSKSHRKPFKILIRTKTEGKNFDAQRQIHSCVMSSKMEYQPEYGASQMSFSELMGEWINLKLRPESILHRVRVDPMKGDTIMVEMKSVSTIANDCQRLYSRCVERQLSLIQIMFDHISPLPPGNYMLNHDLKDKGFMYIYHERLDNQKRSVMNLNIQEHFKEVNTVGHAEQLAPWTPIDPNILTPTHHHLKWLPCVFPPLSTVAASNKRPSVNDPCAFMRTGRRKLTGNEDITGKHYG
ncbi:hypothetical protein GE061_012230 [Apolygus lucorum]|uniref:Little elongation complex subunit 2 C-terminal domain-containing protein n=1 Tax=Apolygus lucorum TaxID=248454 RepID=A0A6A4JMY7_APOLU|nr:hypothetical protein GE061_012230 [Apolygus lucorum]